MVESRHFNLDTIDTVDAVCKEDQDEDEGDFHAVLEFGHDGALGDEIEHFSLHGEGHGNDEGHEEYHLQHQQNEDLAYGSACWCPIADVSLQGRSKPTRVNWSVIFAICSEFAKVSDLAMGCRKN